MRLLAALFAACLAPAVAEAQATAEAAPSQGAGFSPVVLELYTSQGCSSCPPADTLFAELAARDDVIALALHVDYWDYLGWKDIFARPRHTARQKAYAKAVRSRTIFTPEVIVQGEDRLKGHDAAGILDEIAEHRREPAGATLSVERDGGALRIDVAPPGGAPSAAPLPEAAMAMAGPQAAGGAADVHVVRYLPEAEVAIEGGENAGQTVSYANIVTDWQTVGQWDGRTEADFVLPDPGTGPLAVIVQRVRMGPILAAARLP